MARPHGQVVENWPRVQVFLMSKVGVFFLQPTQFTSGGIIALPAYLGWWAKRRLAQPASI